MTLRFCKYQSNGNDFILIDNRSFVFRNYPESVGIIMRICNRRFGIGGDGLIFINKSNEADFDMIYFNSDGKEGSMCGNGGICSVAFANYLGIIKDSAIFKASDGLHNAVISDKEKELTSVNLKMQDVKEIKRHENFFVLNTGSPHYVIFTENVKNIDVFSEGSKIRHNKIFNKDGINVNFAELHKNHIFVRTYERGVEAETLSCGTGVTATALAASLLAESQNKTQYDIKAPGGNFTVRFNKISETSFDNIWLDGSAVHIFKGEINI